MLGPLFDCLNIRYLEKHQKKIKPFQKSHTNENNKRCSWMTNQFLSCLNIWKENTQNRSGGSTQNARSKMFVSLQTCHDIQIAVRSTVETVKPLLQNS